MDFEEKYLKWTSQTRKKVLKEAKREKYFKLAKKLTGIMIPMLFREKSLLISHPEGSPLFMLVSMEESIKSVTVTLGNVSKEGDKTVLWSLTKKADEPPKKGTIEPSELVSAFMVNFPEFVVSLENGKPLVLESGGNPNFMGLKYFITVVEGGATQFRLAIPG